MYLVIPNNTRSAAEYSNPAAAGQIKLTLISPVVVVVSITDSFAC